MAIECAEAVKVNETIASSCTAPNQESCTLAADASAVSEISSGDASAVGGISSANTSAVDENSSADASVQEKGKKTTFTKMLWAAGGFLFFGIGMVGVVLPILPTTPFLLVAAFFFARSSERVNAWFLSTKLYKQVLEGYATKRMMTWKSKLTILVPVTILLTIGFLLMGRVPVGRIVLVVVWVAHVIYFGFVVKTDKEG